MILKAVQSLLIIDSIYLFRVLGITFLNSLIEADDGLKRLEADTLRRIERLQKLVEMNGADGVSEALMRAAPPAGSRGQSAAS